MKEISLLLVTIWPMIGALLVVLLGRKKDKLRFNLAILVTIVEFLMLLYLVVIVLQEGEVYFTLQEFIGFSFALKIDGFRIIYSLIAGFMWLCTTGYTKEYLSHYKNQARYLFFTLVTFGATIGVFLSVDLYTTFIYFEIMSFTSYVMVIHDQKEEAMKAGEVYIAVAVIGGLTMLMGLFLLYNTLGTLHMEQLNDAMSNGVDLSMVMLSGLLILVGFGAKAGLYPLHIWLPKAHPVAPAPASALLSGILTKAGVYGMIVLAKELFRENTNWAMLMLILGVITMVLGAVLALFSNNLKRTLACSSMSQIGFITVGIAMSIFLGSHNTLAIRGVVLHMANHSLIKLLLFMAAGVIYSNTHQLDLNKIQGYGRKKWGLMILFLIGALGIGGIPLFNGYVSKTLLHESIVEYIHLAETINVITFFQYVEYAFLFAGGLTIAYMTKLFICIFIEKNSDDQLQIQFDSMKKIMRKESWFYIAISAIPLLLMGLFPNIVADGLADLMQGFMHAHHLDHAVHYFAWINLKGAVISITIGALIYVFFVRMILMKKENSGYTYKTIWPQWLDLESLLYRPLVQRIIPAILSAFTFIAQPVFENIVIKSVSFVAYLFTRTLSSLGDWLMALTNFTILKRKKKENVNEEDNLPGKFVVEYADHPKWSEIESSLTFGLLAFGVGICICLIYLLASI